MLGALMRVPAIDPQIQEMGLSAEATGLLVLAYHHDGVSRRTGTSPFVQACVPQWPAEFLQVLLSGLTSLLTHFDELD